MSTVCVLRTQMLRRLIYWIAAKFSQKCSKTKQEKPHFMRPVRDSVFFCLLSNKQSSQSVFVRVDYLGALHTPALPEMRELAYVSRLMIVLYINFIYVLL